MSLAVIGTDTDIGKTIACAALLMRYGRRQRLAYWKPIATGGSRDRDTEVVRALCAGTARTVEESYRFDPPVSPHLAARWARTSIEPERLLDHLARHRQRLGCPLVVEGIGGLLVPLSDTGYLLADLLQAMKLPCLLVASSRVGTINHTLLTLEAMRRRNLELAGVLLNGPPDRDNREAIARFGETAVVGELQPLEPLSSETLRAHSETIDAEGILGPYFREG